MFIGYDFPKKLGLDSNMTSWDRTTRIPRWKLCIWSYSQVCRSKSRPKYLNIYVLIRSGPRPFFNWFIGLGNNRPLQTSCFEAPNSGLSLKTSVKPGICFSTRFYMLFWTNSVYVFERCSIRVHRFAIAYRCLHVLHSLYMSFVISYTYKNV